MKLFLDCFIVFNVCNFLSPCYVIQMFFAASILHVHLMQWDDMNLVEAAVNQCDEVWETIRPENVCLIFFYNILWLENLTYYFV